MSILDVNCWKRPRTEKKKERERIEMGSKVIFQRGIVIVVREKELLSTHTRRFYWNSSTERANRVTLVTTWLDKNALLVG